MKTPKRSIHEITSIGRPLDPGYPTNRAVLLLLPLAAIVAGGFAAAGGAGIAGVLGRAAGGALAAFGAWALAREVVPDDEIVGAFGAMALGFVAYTTLEVALLPLYAALLFARVVNRSTGLPATGLDSLVVSTVALLTAWQADTPWPAAAGAAAFAFDAVLRPHLARQWLFAGLTLAGGVALSAAGFVPWLVPVQPDLAPRAIATIVTVGVIALVLATRTVRARADVTEEPLSVARVRAAQIVTLLTALATAASGSIGIEAGALIWAVLAAGTVARVPAANRRR